MEAVNSESLQQSINLEQNTATVDKKNNCLTAINLSKNTWETLSKNADILQFDNDKRVNIFNTINTNYQHDDDEYVNNNENKYSSGEEDELNAEVDDDKTATATATTTTTNHKIIDNNSVNKERTNNVLHKLDDKCDNEERVTIEECNNHHLNNNSNHNNGQIINCQITKNADDDDENVMKKDEITENVENQAEKLAIELENSFNNKHEEEEKTKVEDAKCEETVENNVLLNNVPIINTDHAEDEAPDVPVEHASNSATHATHLQHIESLQSLHSLDCEQHNDASTTHSRSRCSSISSSASSSSSSSSSTPNLVIDQLPTTQQLLKRKSSSSSLTDAECTPAKQAHMDCSSSDDTNISDAVEQQQSPQSHTSMQIEEKEVIVNTLNRYLCM